MAIPSISLPIAVTATAKPAASTSVDRVARNREAVDVTTTSASSSGQSNPATAVHQEEPSRQQIDRAMEHMRESISPMARNLQFSLDTDTGRTVVKVVDSSTNEVIRQIPSEELLSLAKTLDKFTGLLLKQKA